MLTSKEKCAIWQAELIPALDKVSASMPPHQKIIVNASIKGLFNMLRTAKEENLQKMFSSMHVLSTTFINDYETPEDFKAKIQDIGLQWT